MSRNVARRTMTLRKAPPRSAELAQRGDLLWIPTEYLQPDPNQPRQNFTEATLNELAESLTDIGVLTPLRVRPADDAGMHVITDGERRWRAGQIAGVVAFPCLVDAADPATAFLEAYLANLHRDSLTPVDAAMGLQHLRESFSLAGDDEVAARIKKSVGWVRQMNAILALDPQTRTTLQERSEPVAIAVGLRPQTPAERKLTLDAIAELPSRDAKVEFTGQVNRQRRAGTPIRDAITIARAALDRKERPTTPGGGRPREFVFPVEWAETNGSWTCAIHPGVLATTRLAARSTVTLDEWCNAVVADLQVVRSVSIDTEGAPREAWQRTASALQYQLLDGSPGNG